MSGETTKGKSEEFSSDLLLGTPDSKRAETPPPPCVSQLCVCLLHDAHQLFKRLERLLSLLSLSMPSCRALRVRGSLARPGECGRCSMHAAPPQVLGRQQLMQQPILHDAAAQPQPAPSHNTEISDRRSRTISSTRRTRPPGLGGPRRCNASCRLCSCSAPSAPHAARCPSQSER